MVEDRVHLLKLCVGADEVADLVAWQARQRNLQRAQGLKPQHVHVTRMWPKREAELLNGGSLYWVFRGLVLARQCIRALDEVIGEDGIRRCAIVLADDVIRTEPMARRPFQGWRYLADADAPRDLMDDRPTEADLPHDLMMALDDLGVR